MSPRQLENSFTISHRPLGLHCFIPPSLPVPVHTNDTLKRSANSPGPANRRLRTSEILPFMHRWTNKPVFKHSTERTPNTILNMEEMQQGSQSPQVVLPWQPQSHPSGFPSSGLRGSFLQAASTLKGMKGEDVYIHAPLQKTQFYKEQPMQTTPCWMKIKELTYCLSHDM